jgi:hypothetical protein
MIVAAIALSALPMSAQRAPVSPHETIQLDIPADQAKVSITYGRPFTVKPGTTEKRKIWGSLVPYDKVWRLGADAATLIVTTKPIVVGGVTIPAGTNSLYMLPVENGPSKLIINKQHGQWGLTYDEKQDIGRVDLKKESIEKPVDQFTLALDSNPAGGGAFKISWENTQFSVPFTVAK